jgi:uncharacterized protein with HEPN domain
MRREDRNAAYLWDMVQAARDASAVTAGLTEEQLRRDRVRMLALERSMELIGEAARRVGSSFREKHLHIPWREIVGLRNILAHEYGRVDHARLYATAIKELPGLIEALEKLLPPER